MAKKIGICAVYKKHQYAGGAYSFSENLLRGFTSLRETLAPQDRFDLVAFVGAQGIPWSHEHVDFRRMADPLGRWPVETRVGMFDSRGFEGVLFPNTFTPPFVAAKRAVTVIHDLQYLKLSEHWPLAKRAWMRTCHEVTLRRCDAVVAISHWVKEDILKHYGQRWESRIHTIWNPVSFDRFIGPAKQPYTNGRPYILCTAADRPVKNLATLIRAFALLRSRFPEHCLVLAGQLRSEYQATWHRETASIRSKMPSAIDLVNDLGLSKDVVITGFVSDAQLGALYREAALLVLPSLFEGFGMPAVESMALGAPALVSDLAVLREVTCNEAHYISDPMDQHQMADGIAQILKLGDQVRPSAEMQSKIRERFAPITVARKYQKLLMGDA